jgi:tripartite-type tricarboxylate transporter receptor subunit TctC
MSPKGMPMKFPCRQFLYLAAALSTICIFGHASSQTMKTIKIVVPFPPGGGADILARLLAEQVGRMQGSTMVIENRPGASSVIGTEAASRATPGGNNLLIIQPPFVINPHLRKLNYDPLTGFEPICSLATTPTVIVVNSTSPYLTLTDLLNAARAKPGDLTMAVIPAAPQHIALETLKRAANVDITLVPYSGTAPQVTALLGEHVTAVFSPYAVFSDHLKSGRLRALTTTSPTRFEMLPDVPTLAESGYNVLDGDVWTGIAAPAKTSKDSVSQLVGWFTAAMLAPEIKTKLAAQGQVPVAVCGTDFATFLRKQYNEYGRAIREANIKAE